MKKAKKILGEELTNKTIEKIEQTILKDDPTWLIEQRIEHEVRQACRKKPFTFEEMENIIKIYNPPNGLELNDLCDKLSDFTNNRRSLIDQNLRVINHIRIAISYGIISEFKSYFRAKTPKRKQP